MNGKFKNKKKFNKKQKNFDGNLIVKAPLLLDDNISDDVAAEIYEVLENTPFNKISIPANVPRRFVADNVPASDLRVSTIGYIKYCNTKEDGTVEFTIVIYKAYKENISEISNLVMKLAFTSTDTNLKTITKFVLDSNDEVVEVEDPIAAEATEEESEEVEEEAEETKEVEDETEEVEEPVDVVDEEESEDAEEATVDL